MNRATLLLACAFCAILFSRCTKDAPFDTTEPQTIQTAVTPKRYVVGGDHTSGPIVLGDPVNVPYKIENMQQAMTQLQCSNPEYANVNIEANALYVRFLPKDFAEYDKLIKQYDLALFDFPLDREILMEGSYYQDDSLPEDQITWQYTTVPVSFPFPSDIQYEILEEAYIPGMSSYDGITCSESDRQPYDNELERLAFELCGFESEIAESDVTESGIFDKAVNPQGQLRVYNNDTQQYEGIKYVKVYTAWFFNISHTATDENGNYRIPRKYQCNPLYWVKFENQEYPFKIYQKAISLTPALHNMRVQSRYGYNQDLSQQSDAWILAAINNAAVNYWDECSFDYAPFPPNDIRILTINSGMGSCCCMLHHMSPVLQLNVQRLLPIFNRAVNINISTKWLKKILPDIIIDRTNRTSYANIFKTVSHELSHASHYSQAGPQYWSMYVQYILDCFNQGLPLYGEQDTPFSGICGVGETWAYFAEYDIYRRKYTPNQTEPWKFSYPGAQEGVDFWFKPEILWELQEYLSPKEMFVPLTIDRQSIEQYRESLIDYYKGLTTEINNIFDKYGFGREGTPIVIDPWPWGPGGSVLPGGGDNNPWIHP